MLQKEIKNGTFEVYLLNEEGLDCFTGLNVLPKRSKTTEICPNTVKQLQLVQSQ